MIVKREPDSGDIVLDSVDAFLMGILRRIPDETATAGDAAAEERLYPEPAPQDPDFNELWEDSVKPDLIHLFQEATEVVRTDLGLVGNAESVRVPRNHFDAWLSALNQARLSLAARHRFSEDELTNQIPQRITQARDLALFQIHFYALIQELLIGEISGDVAGG